MFPSTAQVETVVLLSRKNPDDRIEIDLDLNELDITTGGCTSATMSTRKRKSDNRDLKTF